MTPPLPWVFEPVDPAEGTLAPTGKPYPHAVRGMKPAGRRVMGYGQTEPAAYQDARRKAQEADAREVVGERGEVRVSMGWIELRNASGDGGYLLPPGTPHDVIDTLRGTMQWDL